MNFAALAFKQIGVTEADVQAGCKDVSVRFLSGPERTVRLCVIPEPLRADLLKRYVATEDARVIVRPLLAPEFASDEFLASLQPGSLMLLANVALVLLFGTAFVGRMLEHGLQISGEPETKLPNIEG